MHVIHIGSSNGSRASFPVHRHECWEVIYGLSGTGQMLLGGSTCPFSPGTIAVVPPETVHGKKADESFTEICIFIEDFRPVGKEAARILQDDSSGSVKEIMQLALRFADLTSLYKQALADSIADVLYQLLVNLYVAGRPMDARLDSVFESMYAHFQDPDYNVSSAFRVSGYSEGHFRRLFREVTGVSPVRYLQRIRIDYARSLLQQFGPSKSIAEIAHACGYRDQLYFSRVFRQCEGVSPTDYYESLLVSRPEAVDRKDGSMEIWLSGGEARALSLLPSEETE